MVEQHNYQKTREARNLMTDTEEPINILTRDELVDLVIEIDMGMERVEKVIDKALSPFRNPGGTYPSWKIRDERDIFEAIHDVIYEAYKLGVNTPLPVIIVVTGSDSTDKPVIDSLIAPE